MRTGAPAERAGRASRRLLAGIAIGTVALAALFAVGPRPDLTVEVDAVVLPADLDAYLAASEAQFPDLVLGAEKKIVWHDPANPGRTPLSVVYFHGFSATRRETAPLADSVASRLGANLFYTRLTGHGRSGDAMTEGSVQAWARDASEAMAIGERLGERVILIGTSQGGTLALWAAAQPTLAERLEALVLISPNLGPRDGRSWILTWPWGERIANWIQGPTYAFEPQNPFHERFWTEEYPTSALIPMMGLVKLTAEMDGSSVRAPVFMAYSPSDQVVDPERALDRLETLSSNRTEIHVVEGAEDRSQHVLAGDILSPSTTIELVDLIVRFVGQVR